MILALLLTMPAVAQPRLESSAVMSGVGQYQEKTWGTVAATVVNPTDAPVDVMLVHQFDNLVNVQFGAQVWLPPQSSRKVWLPVRPGEIAEDARGLNLTSLLLDARSSPETQYSRAPGLLPVARDEVLSGIMADGDGEGAADAAVALRDATGLGRRMMYLRSDALPPVYAAWDALDAMVLAASEPQLDSAQSLALRQWLIAGGRLWVCLDRVNPDAMKALLGEDWTLEVIDRVSYNDITIESPRREFSASSETPFEMVRAVAQDMEVTHTANGWPAAMRKQIGRGRLLVTTVDGRAWLDANGEASDPLQDLGPYFFRRQAEDPLPPSTLQPFLARQIGYTIMTRGPIVAVLGAFCLLLMASGFFLARQNRLEHLGWVGPALALVVAALLVGTGMFRRGQVPLTVASSQFVEVVPSQQHAVISGLMSIYSPARQEGLFRASEGGIVWSDLPQTPDKPLRTIWTDIDRWHWENFDLPAGATLDAEFVKSTPLDHPIAAEVVFADQGARIRLQTGELQGLEDTLVASQAGVLAPATEPDGFLARPQDVLRGDRYIVGSASILSSTQQRRQEIYRQLLGESHYAKRPMLLTWAQPMNLGMSLPEQARMRDSALISIPLNFEASEPGSRVTIPSVFLPFDVMSKRQLEEAGRPLADKTSLSTIYNEQTGEWIGQLSSPARVMLRFHVPPSVLPLTVTGARMTIAIDAPSRTLTVSGYQDGRPVPLASATSPDGSSTLALEAGPLLQPDAQGAVYLLIDVSDVPEITGLQPSWVLTDVSLELSGVVAGDAP